MLETLSVRSRICDQIRSGPLGRWVDDFVDVLIMRGYATSTVRRYVRAAVAASCAALAIIAASTLARAPEARRTPAGARTVGVVLWWSESWGSRCGARRPSGSDGIVRLHVWTVPATRTKAKREHRVPLSRRGEQILDAARATGNGGPLVFSSARGKRLNNMALSGLLKDLEIGVVPHGFRSTFRDWAAEETNHPREVVEAALAHVVQNKVEAAYARSDLFERRRQLMDDWAAYLDRDCGRLDRSSGEALS